MSRVASNTRSRHQMSIDQLHRDSVVLDCFGHAWQYGGIYWYRAYGDDSRVSSYDLSFKGPFKVLFKAPLRESLAIGVHQ